jgi:hypothetical protein
MFPVGELGVGHPVLMGENPINWKNQLEVDDPDAEPGLAGPGQGAQNVATKKLITVPRYDFTLQFCWKEPPVENPALVAQEQPVGAGGPAAPSVPEVDAAEPAEATAEPRQPGQLDAAPGAADQVPADGAPAAENLGDESADPVEPEASEPSGDSDEPAEAAESAAEQAETSNPN